MCVNMIIGEILIFICNVSGLFVLFFGIMAETNIVRLFLSFGSMFCISHLAVLLQIPPAVMVLCTLSVLMLRSPTLRSYHAVFEMRCGIHTKHKSLG